LGPKKIRITNRMTRSSPPPTFSNMTFPPLDVVRLMYCSFGLFARN